MNPVKPSESVEQTRQSGCDNGTILKISLVILGLLLICGSIAAHMYQVNSIAVYTMGGAGGFLILATAIGSTIQWISKQHESFDSEPEVAPIENESPPPREIVSKLPAFLQKIALRIFYLQLADGVEINHKAFKNCGRSLVLYSQGSKDFGIYMKLQVTHMMLDSTFDRSKFYKFHDEDRELPSSGQPFTIEILACFRDLRRGEWSLVSKPHSNIMHRNASFNTHDILMSHDFIFSDNTLPSTRQIARFTDTKRQDGLPDDERFHLAWILLRLLNGRDLEVREWKRVAAREYFGDSAIGYWQLSLCP